MSGVFLLVLSSKLFCSRFTAVIRQQIQIVKIYFLALFFGGGGGGYSGNDSADYSSKNTAVVPEI